MAAQSAQEEFDAIYITSSEICKRLRITRATIVQGRRRGLLPDPIVVNDGQLLVWKRAEIMLYLDAWNINLRARRGELVA